MNGLMIWVLGIFLYFSATAHASQFEIVEWRGRQALKMTGPINSGTAARFNEIADGIEPAEHGLPVLLLDSPGGSVFEALLLSAAMKNRPFHTVIPDGASCASACASIVFIAGKYRTMEHFGRFGQHSCSVSGTPDTECNELISQHAMSNGVSHGSVAAFVTYTAPTEMLWFSRADIDGWGISHYPGSEESGFEKSEPRIFKAITGKTPPAQAAWRLDFWKNGWRAFNRSVSDAERELQLNQFCVEHIPGVLFLAIEIHGPSEKVEEVTQRVVLLTDEFSLETTEPMIWQEDRLVTMVAIPIPTEKVLPWLTEVSQYEFRVDTKKPYEPIGAHGFLSGSRDNLIFAANNCDYSTSQ